MIRQVDKPTILLTLSAEEYKWIEFRITLYIETQIF